MTFREHGAGQIKRAFVAIARRYTRGDLLNERVILGADNEVTLYWDGRLSEKAASSMCYRGLRWAALSCSVEHDVSPSRVVMKAMCISSTFSVNENVNHKHKKNKKGFISSRLRFA
ncbi:hypothetical protein AtDm6_2700 [Acetobacter tropicalis]|uniref:Uncharacterized protein n=1 Tax=Acetobacter tropicalis TaxID=104102 RepID=A0A094YMT7_9PROT|nr:hypothetical protein AtDm6_2700 [Acetobacter tropicalis]